MTTPNKDVDDIRVHGDFMLQMMDKYFPDVEVIIEQGPYRMFNRSSSDTIVMMRCKGFDIDFTYSTLLSETLKYKFSFSVENFEVVEEEDGLCFQKVYWIREKQ